MSADDLLAALDAGHDARVDFLQRFARIDTANPPGDTTRAADLFRAFLDAEGIAHRTEAPLAHAPNLIATFEGGAGPGRHLVLNGHLDVFPIGDRASWARDPWSGDIADGRLHGRGTVDMKSGTTALLHVFAALHRLRAKLRGRVTLTVVSDEETGGKWGAAWLIENRPDEVLGDCVLNTEPSGLATVRFGEKCMLWLRFVIAVKGGHSAYPHTGQSANKVAAALIRDLQEIEAMVPDEPATVRATLDREEVRAAADLSLGAGAAGVMRRVSVNIGTIQGGVTINMLPPRCVLEVDCRLPVGIPRAAVLARATEIAARHPGTTFEEMLPGGPEATVSDPTHEMMGHLLRRAAHGQAKPPQPIVSLGGTDTRFWRARGVPAFVYGCSPAGMGGIDESVSLAEFDHVTRTHALAAWDYLTLV
ncbi:M20/M25/M40 family metallo-hydrolase [Reyranella sp.]|uniref:M20/M25/M40 family metallo-hydrolase n=1 Tax=Reyranella sp. TaxID=1929291 RepID=UPI003BA903A7